MARDRLAAMRAQQQQAGGEYDTNSNSYPTQQNSGYGGGGGGAGGARRQNPYAQQDDRSYEMADVHQSSTQLMGGDMSAFYEEIGSVQDSLRSFNDNVAQIGDLHSRSLNNTDDAAAQRNAQALDSLIQDTTAMSMELKRRIKALEATRGSGRDGQIRGQQSALVKSKFVEALQSYQQVEQQYRQRYKQRMERQFRIVKPDATPEEVKAVVDDTQGGQVFQQALMSSNRYGESKAAYREVQERHEDIKRIEQTITELAQLMNDMSIMVEQQDEQINVIQETAAKVETDMEAGLGYTDTAVKSARAARKKRWICFGITIVLLIIIAIVVAVEVLKKVNTNKSKNDDTKTVTEAAPASTRAAIAVATTVLAVRATPLLTWPATG